ncbi:hypothetical protein A1D23_08445 [Chelonobacter oris]|nr:hypothetical protein [Chelonobacter oris]
MVFLLIIKIKKTEKHWTQDGKMFTARVIEIKKSRGFRWHSCKYSVPFQNARRHVGCELNYFNE